MQTASSEAAVVFEALTRDFDGDGTEETFQLRREGKMLKLWFVEEQQEKKLAEEKNFIEYGPEQQNLQAYELSEGIFCVVGESDTAQSVVYTVSDGVATEQEVGPVSNFSRQEDGSFVGQASALDVGYTAVNQKQIWGGRTRKPYWFYWDKTQFAEYGAQLLSWDQLETFGGLQHQVEQRISEWNREQFPQGTVTIDGQPLEVQWEVCGIWLRENGMLNINYGYDYLSSAGNGGGGRRYDTFQIEQQTARLIDSGEGSYREALWK